jgi:hypothetical protein
MMNEERGLRHHCEVSNNLKTEVLRVRQQQNQAINESRPPTNTTKWVIQTPIPRQEPPPYLQAPGKHEAYGRRQLATL